MSLHSKFSGEILFENSILRAELACNHWMEEVVQYTELYSPSNSAPYQPSSHSCKLQLPKCTVPSSIMESRAIIQFLLETAIVVLVTSLLFMHVELLSNISMRGCGRMASSTLSERHGT